MRNRGERSRLRAGRTGPPPQHHRTLRPYRPQPAGTFFALATFFVPDFIDLHAARVHAAYLVIMEGRAELPGGNQELGDGVDDTPANRETARIEEPSHSSDTI